MYKRQVLNGGTNVQYAEGQVDSRANLCGGSKTDSENHYLTVEDVYKRQGPGHPLCGRLRLRAPHRAGQVRHRVLAASGEMCIRDSPGRP